MRFVDAHDFSVDLVLRVLGIPASTYYDWRARRTSPSPRACEDARLLGMIDEIRGEHEFAATYGSPRVWLELRRRGVRVGRKRVERIMREHGRKGAYLRRGWKGGSTRQNPRHTAAPDLLDRDFTTTAPNRKWVADLTRIATREGVLWLASVRDAFSNKVVGWRSGPRADTDLVLSALDYAIWSRDIRDGQLIHHSDKGCQYTAVRFTQRLVDARPGGEPVVGPQDRADLLARNHFHNSSRSRGGVVPLHRWLVQPAPHPGRSQRTLTRRIRGGVLHRPRQAPTGYAPTRASRIQIARSPENRGNF